MTPTERGVCTNCWGSKGGRLFTLAKRGPRGGGDNPSYWFWPWGCSFTALVFAGIAITTLSEWI